jgi:hypothetical protein
MRIRSDINVSFSVAAVIISILLIACSSGKEVGIEQCIQACRGLVKTSCDTRAVDFCRNAEESCEARYDAHPDCQAQLEMMDRCAGAQPATSFVCPLGTISDEIRPYRLTEDVCLDAAKALQECL